MRNTLSEQDCKMEAEAQHDAPSSLEPRGLLGVYVGLPFSSPTNIQREVKTSLSIVYDLFRTRGGIFLQHMHRALGYHFNVWSLLNLHMQNSAIMIRIRRGEQQKCYQYAVQEYLRQRHGAILPVHSVIAVRRRWRGYSCYKAGHSALAPRRRGAQ